MPIILPHPVGHLAQIVDDCAARQGAVALECRDLVAYDCPLMIRLREIDDEQLRERVRAKIAESRGMLPGEIADWWELDDADFSEILINLRYEDEGRVDDDR